MKANDLQQCLNGFRTVYVADGPLPVHVHEALDKMYVGTKHRYFITLDLKFRQSDALNIGKLGWLGQTKAEAIREANELAHKLYVANMAAHAATEFAALHDTPTNRHTARIQADKWYRLTTRYNAELT